MHIELNNADSLAAINKRSWVFLLCAALLGACWYLALTYTTMYGVLPAIQRLDGRELTAEWHLRWLVSLVVASVATSALMRKSLLSYRDERAARLGMMLMVIAAMVTTLMYGLLEYVDSGRGNGFLNILLFPVLVASSPWILAYAAGYGWIMSAVARWAYPHEVPPEPEPEPPLEHTASTWAPSPGHGEPRRPPLPQGPYKLINLLDPPNRIDA